MFIRALIAGESDVQHALKDAVIGGSISQAFFNESAMIKMVRLCCE